MEPFRPLPPLLARRYRGWKATEYEDNKGWYIRLAEDGQHPRAMVISCCDSRVHASSIFGADSGELFIHRNIANLVPPFAPNGDYHGTSAAVEYAVNSLKVAHILVLGHSQCGGIQSCMELCEGRSIQLQEKSSFVGQWLSILKPGYDRIRDKINIPAGSFEDPAHNLKVLEEESVIISLENLLSFPFVAEAVQAGSTSLHGLWHDIGTGTLFYYDAQQKVFLPV